MRLLLDTHVWIWALEKPHKLNPRFRRLLGAATTEVHLSPISIWEAQHMVLRNRLRIRASFDTWLEDARNRTPVHEVPVSFAIASAVGKIELPQPDLGDLFLAATAIVLDLTLATADQQLLDLRGVKTIEA